MYTVEQIRIAGTEGEVNHHDVEHIISTLEILYGSGNSQNSGKPLVSRSAEFEKPKDPHGSNTMLAAAAVDRITPENISSIAENEVFVFGSNLSGRHGKGAAKTALGWGAKWGQAAGIQGKTYGIPTKDAAIKRTLRIDEIKPFVDDFIEWAKCHTGNTFYVTEIGCGLAGYKPKDIAPLFAECVNLKNVKLPQRFWHKLGGSNSR